MIACRDLPDRSRRGSVVVVVLWAIALGSIIVAAVQFSAQRQSAAGVRAVERVRARWAARAGVERMVSIIGWHTETPIVDDAFALYRDMGNAAYAQPGDLNFASYAIEYERDGQVYAGPLDEHARFNINLAVDNKEPLLNIGLTEDVVDSIVDWVDEDDEISGLGAEAAHYVASGFTYAPRNSYMRSIVELELVLGAYPDYVREEDWNYNNLLDPNEDDGELMMPDDDANGVLERGWAEYLTAYSVGGGLGASGLPRIYLPETTVDEVADRLPSLTPEQAEALVNFGSNPTNRLSSLWVTPINYWNENGEAAPIDGQPVNEALPFDVQQFGEVFSETTMDDPDYRVPGKININTTTEEVLRDVLLLDPAVVDEIIHYRERTPQGFRHIGELPTVSPVFTTDVLAEASELLDTTSNVFTIVSTGRSEKTGTEVQLIVVVDRSTLPIQILEYREQ